MKTKKYHTSKLFITSIGKSCKDTITQINFTAHTHDLVHALQSKVEGLRRYQGVIRSRRSKKDRQYNVKKKSKGQTMNYKTRHEPS